MDAKLTFVGEDVLESCDVGFSGQVLVGSLHVEKLGVGGNPPSWFLHKKPCPPSNVLDK